MRNLNLSASSCALNSASSSSALRRASFLVIGMMLASSSVSRCHADEPSIYLVEEEWEMVINQPDPASHSPQVTFFMSPSGAEDTYFQLQLNYAADEDFSGGGFHVAAVINEDIQDEERSTTQLALTTAHDHVRWTSVMALIDGNLYYAVKNGQCQDWGAFGGPDYLVQMPSSVSDLSAYHPQNSLDTVDVGFGGNRVGSVTLRRIKVHYSDGTVQTMPVNLNP